MSWQVKRNAAIFTLLAEYISRNISAVSFKSCTIIPDIFDLKAEKMSHLENKTVESR